MNSAAFRKDVDKVQGRMNRLSKGMRRSANQFQSQMGAIGATIASGFGVNMFLDAADQMVGLRNKMNATYDSSQQVAEGMLNIKRIARESRGDLDAVGSLYQRLAVSTKYLNVSQDEVAAATQVVSNSFLMSGASASEAANSARQLAQGLASNTLRGDEYRSVAENNVVLTNMLAEGLGMTVGQLRLFSQTGGLTAGVILPILVERLQETKDAVGKMGFTVQQARVLMKNSFTEMVDRLNSVYGITNKAAEIMMVFTRNIHIVTLAAGSLATLMLTRVLAGFVSFIVVSVTGAISALVSFGVALVVITAKLLVISASVAFLSALLIGGLMHGLLNATLAVGRFALALALTPVGIVVLGLAALAAGLVYLEEKFHIFDRFGSVFESLGLLAPAVMDTIMQSFDILLLKVEIITVGIREKIADMLSGVGADSLAGMVRPGAGIADALAQQYADVATNTDNRDAMVGAFANLRGAATGPQSEGPSQVAPMIAWLKEKYEALTSGDETGESVEGEGGLSLASMGEGFSVFVDGVLAKMGESMPGLARFWKVLKGEIDPDADAAAAAGGGTEDAAMSWADRWGVAVAGFKANFKSMSDSVSAQVTQMGKKYETYGQILDAGAARSKKIAAIKRALLLKEALMTGKTAIMNAWASAPFPANLPGVAMTTLQTGLIISDIMKGQAHDGMDSLPSTGTYMLEKGERVLSTKANRDLTQYLADNQRSQGMGGAQSITLQVNGVNDPDLVVNALESRRGELESMIRSISAENVQAAPF